MHDVLILGYLFVHLPQEERRPTWMISVLRILLKNNNPYQAILDRMKTSACQTSRESMGEKTSSNNFDLVLGDLDHTHVISDLDLGNLDL